jgi:hypothetical protein
MPLRTKAGLAFLISMLLLLPVPQHSRSAENDLPAFGRDTVLVWKIRNLEYSSDFVVRVAAFSPDRFLEWEDEKAQGTVFMPGHGISRTPKATRTHSFSLRAWIYEAKTPQPCG